MRVKGYVEVHRLMASTLQGWAVTHDGGTFKSHDVKMDLSYTEKSHYEDMWRYSDNHHENPFLISCVYEVVKVDGGNVNGILLAYTIIIEDD